MHRPIIWPPPQCTSGFERTDPSPPAGIFRAADRTQGRPPPTPPPPHPNTSSSQTTSQMSIRPDRAPASAKFDPLQILYFFYKNQYLVPKINTVPRTITTQPFELVCACCARFWIFLRSEKSQASRQTKKRDQRAKKRGASWSSPAFVPSALSPPTESCRVVAGVRCPPPGRGGGRPCPTITVYRGTPTVVGYVPDHSILLLNETGNLTPRPRIRMHPPGC